MSTLDDLSRRSAHVSAAERPNTTTPAQEPSSADNRQVMHELVLTSLLAAGKPLVSPSEYAGPAYLFCKRTMDIAGALLLILAMSPVLIVVLLSLMLTTRGRPIYAQERIGRCGRRFRMLKFRTMVLDADAQQHLIENEKEGPIFKNRLDPRVTRIGRWLRRTSLDETPQLVNVLLGHMSLVGPRPPVAKEVVKYQTWQLQRLSVKPGLTCLWQVSGRSELHFDDWMQMDLWYVENQSLRVDLWLLLRTPWSVLTCRGAY